MRSIVIVGGGTAGWLVAGVVAARHRTPDGPGLRVTLVESSDIPTIGVGEGTWPTLKNTLQDIGIAESDLFSRCQAGFKQGGKFIGWAHGKDDFYYHPFTVPLGYGRLDLAPYLDDIKDYAASCNFQHRICEAGLAPRTLAEEEFKGPCNYAYHLDAGAFAVLLREHCVENLGVRHVVDTVEQVSLGEGGDISGIHLQQAGVVSADLFVDCTGFASRLLGEALDVPFVERDDVLFNDRALAMQVPYGSDNDPMACHTIATAQATGWIWDIGLTHRRGVGHVYASRFCGDDEAERNLRDYLGPAADGLDARRIQFRCGHRQAFWKRNCVAVGLSAGFVEPLEATAIMLAELSARYIAEHFPPDESAMPIVAKRFNRLMDYRWRRIIDFLKLHYTLSQRPEPYWAAHRDPAGVPDSLAEDMTLWKSRGPVREDFESSAELFPAASYQYVIYGMEFEPEFSSQRYLHHHQRDAQSIMARNAQLTEQLLSTLPPHRQFIRSWLAASGRSP